MSAAADKCFQFHPPPALKEASSPGAGEQIIDIEL